MSVINSLSVRHQQLLKLFSCGLEGPDPASVLDLTKFQVFSLQNSVNP